MNANPRWGSAPRQPAESQAALAPQPDASDPAPRPPRLPWGVVGTNEYQALSTRGSAFGIRRTLEAHADYVAPPLPPGELRWSKIGDLLFEMELPCRLEPASVKTLADLGAATLDEYRQQLHRPPCTSVDDPRLTDLDALVNQLLELIEELHEAGGAVGLLNPESILLLRDPAGQRRLVLPDLGFVREQRRGRPLRWLDADWRSPDGTADGNSFLQRWAPLWGDRPPEEQQSVGNPNEFGQTPIANPLPDVQVLARLLDWLVSRSGVARRTIPADDTDATALVCEVLDRALRGEVYSVGELRRLLNEPANRPSRALLPSTRRPRRSAPATVASWPRPLLTGALLVVLLAAGIWGAVWYINRPLDGPRGPRGSLISAADPAVSPSPELPPESRLAELVHEYRQAATPDEKYAVLLRMMQVRLSPGDSSLRTLEAWHRDHARLDFVRTRMARLGEVPAEVQKRPRFKNSAILEVIAIREQLRELSPYDAHPAVIEQEKRCLEQCQAWLGKYRLA